MASFEHDPVEVEAPAFSPHKTVPTWFYLVLLGLVVAGICLL